MLLKRGSFYIAQSIARYSFIQLSRLGPQWRERKCPIFEKVAKGDSNPGSLDCESSILPLSYRAPVERITVMVVSCSSGKGLFSKILQDCHPRNTSDGSRQGSNKLIESLLIRF